MSDAHPPGPQVSVLSATASWLGEGPVIEDRTGMVLWVDIEAGHVHRLDPTTGADTVVAELDEPVGFVVAPTRADPRTLVGTPSGLRQLDQAAGHPLVAALPERPDGVRMNDGARDPVGRVLGGTMHHQATAGCGTLWSFHDGLATPLLRDLTISNGIGFVDGGSTMLHVDSPTRRVDAYDYDSRAGELGPRRTFAELGTVPELSDGVPDGLTVHGDRLFVAMWGAACVAQLDARTGLVQRLLPIPVQHPTSCLVLPDGDLLVTTARAGGDDSQHAGSVLRVHLATSATAHL